MRSPLARLFNDLNTVFEHVSSSWYVFGAQAAIIHGAARLSADVVITVMYGDGDPADLVQILEGNGFEMQMENPVAFIERTGVLPVIHSASGMPVDIVFGGPGLEEEFAQRAGQYEIEGVKVPVASAEDLVAMKILSGRAKDLDDALAVITARHKQLAWQRIRSVIARLEDALDRSDLTPVLNELVRRAEE